jgi:hypothetical protein
MAMAKRRGQRPIGGVGGEGEPVGNGVPQTPRTRFAASTVDLDGGRSSAAKVMMEGR